MTHRAFKAEFTLRCFKNARWAQRWRKWCFLKTRTSDVFKMRDFCQRVHSAWWRLRWFLPKDGHRLYFICRRTFHFCLPSGHARASNWWLDNWSLVGFHFNPWSVNSKDQAHIISFRQHTDAWGDAVASSIARGDAEGMGGGQDCTCQGTICCSNTALLGATAVPASIPFYVTPPTLIMSWQPADGAGQEKE